MRYIAIVILALLLAGCSGTAKPPVQTATAQPPASTVVPLVARAEPYQGGCPVDQPVRATADKQAFATDHPGYAGAQPVACYTTLGDAVNAGNILPILTPSPTPSLTPLAVPTTVSVRAAMVACYGKLSDALDTIRNANADMTGYLETLIQNVNDAPALRGLLQLASTAQAVSVSVQAVTCDPQVTEFLQLLKAGTMANADGLSLVARGAQAHSTDLIDTGNQKIRDSGAIFKRADALIPGR